MQVRIQTSTFQKLMCSVMKAVTDDLHGYAAALAEEETTMKFLEK